MLDQQHIDNFVTEVLSAHDLARYRDLFLFNREYSKESMSTTCEELIYPHSLTKDEMKIESGQDFCKFSVLPVNESYLIQAFLV